ncbi:MAG: type II secretion system protein GspD, partial [Deltaproteobacteria bacterium RIFCSPLOWO2_02_FULL_46_8]
MKFVRKGQGTMDYGPWTRGRGLFVLLLVLGLWSLVPSSSFSQLPEGSATLPGAEEGSPPAEMPPSLEMPSSPDVPEGAPSNGAPAKPEEEAAVNPSDEKVYLNVQDQDIKEVIKQISQSTGRNFIIDSKVSGKISILSHKMMTKEEAYQAFLSALQVAGFTTVAGPGGILKIIPLRDAKNFPIPTHIDTTPYTDSYITRLIKMENISANDMAEAIKGLISKDGNLFAYPETNTLVLTDSGTNIDRLMKIIKELDQEGPQQVVEIIPLHYAGAKEMAGIILNLFEEQKKQGGGGGRPGAGAGSLEEIAQVSKIIADERTNSLIVLASKRSIEKVRDMISRLDSKLEEGAEGKIHVYYLKYAKAKDLVTVLQGLAGQAAKAPGAGGAAAQGAIIADLEEFKIGSDDATNSLLITSNLKTFNTLIDKVISKIDIPRKQVYLEAMVIEFSLTTDKRAGVSWSTGLASGSTVGFGEAFNQLAGLIDPFNPTNKASALLNAPGLLGGVLSTRTVAVEVIGSDGAKKTVNVPAFSAFLNALSVFGNTNVIASPNLMALDNEEATIEIIRKEPEPGQNILGPSGLVSQGSPVRVDAGLTLKLTPQITEKGSVRMKIDQKYSSFTTAANPGLGTQAIVERKVTTSVITNDAQTVVIGGLMEDDVTTTRTKLPVLGDIPLLGYLFQKKESNSRKKNLLLFVTPYVVRDTDDFNRVLAKKLGQQEDFLNTTMKKKEKTNVDKLIKTHDSDLLDILAKKPGPVTSERAIVSPGTVYSTSNSAPIITAKPEEENHVTIVLPPASESVDQKQKSVIQTTPALTPTPTQTQTTTPPPVQIIPPKKKPANQVKAEPVPAKPAPATGTKTTTTTTTT